MSNSAGKKKGFALDRSVRSVPTAKVEESVSVSEEKTVARADDEYAVPEATSRGWSLRSSVAARRRSRKRIEARARALWGRREALDSGTSREFWLGALAARDA